MKPTYRNILKVLVTSEGWVPGSHLPDGNGRPGGARGEVLTAMKADGFIEYGKEPQQSSFGWKATAAGRSALEAAEALKSAKASQ
ncbi:hypothetical protein FHW79_005350 [Azospirillum sp. OGB3]|uniref:hypothetical protein n=1 Tax=Azospirillum sp. OGB3 TaxID=2587012 RepID=UPI0016059687|nr:hypothetical protein [Azospirillum sp. OGB3]MBB3267685.1 hypothetical protein [Azospirillum sp. OGB3]